MIVAMICVDMVQPACDQIINMVAMRNGRMPAIWPMHMLRVMPVRIVVAGIGIGPADLDDVLVHVVSMHMMEMAVVEEVGMSLMFNGRVAATWAVLMGVVFVLFAITHITPFSLIVECNRLRNIQQ